MIVYNVARHWFSDKGMAEKYRVSLGLKPAATLKVAVENRDELSALLNALCDPGVQEVLAIADKHDLSKIKANVLVDRAYVPVDRSIPDFIPAFLKKDWSVS